MSRGNSKQTKMCSNVDPTEIDWKTIVPKQEREEALDGTEFRENLCGEGDRMEGSQKVIHDLIERGSCRESGQNGLQLLNDAVKRLGAVKSTRLAQAHKHRSLIKIAQETKKLFNKQREREALPV